MRTVMIVDDKEMLRDSVGATLERAGMKVVTAPDGDAALQLCAGSRPDCVVTDMRMPGMTGLELLEKLRGVDDELPVVLMTAFGTIETAVKAMKLGAFDYLTKPFEGDELLITVKRAIDHRHLVRENAVLRAQSMPSGQTHTQPVAGRATPLNGSATNGERRGLDRLVGSSQVIRNLREQIRQVATSVGTVLITGESGVGKEVVAKAIHETSARGGRTFLGVNCAALSQSLLESELFGHEKGAFTGAERTRKGRFELADAGTLLLDEVSEVPPSVQAKLLRVLQERCLERVGSSVTIGVDVRIVATSNRDLPASCAKGDFRQDLYYRISVLPVVIPPLRDRLEDVPELVAHFVGEFCKREGRPRAHVDSAAVDLLQQYNWPGNVRELQNICERAVVLSSSPGAEEAGTITRELIAPWIGHGQTHATHATSISPNGRLLPAQTVEAKPMPGAIAAFTGDGQLKQLEEIEREAIVQTLLRFKGHRQKTAHALGIGVRTLGLKLKKWKQTGLVSETL